MLKAQSEEAQAFQASFTAKKADILARAAAAVAAASSASSPAAAPKLNDTHSSGDAEQEYFDDGIAEDIITALSRFHDLLVIARNSSFVYRPDQIDQHQTNKKEESSKKAQKHASPRLWFEGPRGRPGKAPEASKKDTNLSSILQTISMTSVIVWLYGYGFAVWICLWGYRFQ